MRKAFQLLNHDLLLEKLDVHVLLKLYFDSVLTCYRQGSVILCKDFRENTNLTCRKCTTQSCQSLRICYQETPNILLIQIYRFSVSNLHCRPRKYQVRGLINHTLLGLIEHHGVFINSVMSVTHYVSYIRQNNKWYHCDDKHITETNLLTLWNNIYLMFYAKEINIVSECLAI